MVKQSEDFFNIGVKILEASDLPNPNMSSLASVQVGSSRKYTRVIKNTDKPRFNEYFVFDIKTNFLTLLSTVITISLYEPRNVYSLKKLIGCMSMEVSTVWSHEYRRLKRWFVVTLPSDVTAVSRGFVNCEIIVEASEKFSRVPLLTPMDMPNIIGGSNGRYMVRIYQCIGMDIAKYIDGRQGTKLPDVTVNVIFAGRFESTTKRQLRENPEWNEQITFIELVPPLYQKITIELKINNKVLAVRDFYLNQICYVSKKDGFYPTYGPVHVHLYENELLYKGSLLMEIETEPVSTFKYKEKLHSVLRSPIQPHYENQVRKIERFLLFGVVFDVVLDKKEPIQKPLHLEISFGKRYTRTSTNSNTLSIKYRAQKASSGYQYLPLKEKKPCLFLRSEWPDTRHRLSNTNVVGSLVLHLREAVNNAQNLLARGSIKEAGVVMKAALQHVKKECEEIQRYLTRGVTKLDFERVKLITNHCKRLSSTIVREQDVESLIEKINLFLLTLEEMYESIQDSLPYVFLYVQEGKTILGYCKLHPREIIFNKLNIKTGINAGKIFSVNLQKPDKSNFGHLDVWMWLGLWDDVSHCLRALPPGHEDIADVVALPLNISYTTDEKYAIICHILRGIVEVKNGEGLYDPFVSVILSHHSKETKKVKRSLTPLWKETLIFSDVQLYPDPIYLELNPPLLIVNLLDGSGNHPNLLGTATIKPKVRIQPFTKRLDYSLQWYSIGTSQILAFFEIAQLTERGSEETRGIRKLSRLVPEFLEPPMTTYRLEVVFWGIRGSDTNGLKSIVQPQAIIQCGSVEIKSEFVVRANTVFNFRHDLHVVEIELPETKLYTPALNVRLTTSAKYFGSTLEKNIYKYLYNPPSEKQWNILTSHRRSVIARAQSRQSSVQDTMPDLIPLLDHKSTRTSHITEYEDPLNKKCFSLKAAFKKITNLFKLNSSNNSIDSYNAIEEEEEELDWWNRYILKEMKIYKTKLEDVKGFEKFNDVLKTFAVKQQGKEEGKEIVANVKVMICLYMWPLKVSAVTRQGQDPEMGILKYTELRERVKLLVRVYCIKAYNLHPADPNGSADPFIEIATPSKVVSDVSNYLNQQLNPTFGKCLEITAEFPKDTLLTVRVMDYDRITAHDLVGETFIDLENRFYSKHRATCGLAPSYSKGGHDAWRDVEKPVSILEKLCNSHNLPLPQYYDKSVVVASKEFVIEKKAKTWEETQEKLALQVLRRWNEVPIVGCQLVPEHVETRSIYNNKKRPGIEQGKLEMWVDIFDLSLGEVPPPIDITPRKPQQYDLRVVIWNVVKVPLVDDSFFVGQKHTDIFVKGWLWEPRSAQTTDVHYTSVNGTGNFNWRFIFPFLYLRAEKRMVIYKKNIFEIGKSELKVPALLHFQVWDKDRLSPDDFISSMELDLCHMPRGASSVRFCKIQENMEPSKFVDLFRVKHMKGWWAFSKVNDGVRSPAGFLEADFHLLTADEATASPAGLGRSEPAALPPPLRPEFKVKFWLAPLRVFSSLLCGAYKGKVILCLTITAFAIFAIVGVYSIPMFIIKRIIGA